MFGIPFVETSAKTRMGVDEVEEGYGRERAQAQAWSRAMTRLSMRTRRLVMMSKLSKVIRMIKMSKMCMIMRMS